MEDSSEAATEVTWPFDMVSRGVVSPAVPPAVKDTKPLSIAGELVKTFPQYHVVHCTATLPTDMLCVKHHPGVFGKAAMEMSITSALASRTVAQAACCAACAACLCTCHM